ncbi:hypothetical protein [Pseudomonas leptonychotis]|uniref:hypothetical protein n=1 Tax=Pseudomonas leptonychotis TaxID=2448482 RepID=UPI0010AACB0C|nr:hypothetical protein [Pseudomonas leptonychotis]
MEILFISALAFVGTGMIGVACSYFNNRYLAYFLAAVIPWSAFLIFNIYAENHAPDKAITEGIWGIIQLIFGSILAVTGCFCVWLTSKLSK